MSEVIAIRTDVCRRGGRWVVEVRYRCLQHVQPISTSFTGTVLGSKVGLFLSLQELAGPRQDDVDRVLHDAVHLTLHPRNGSVGPSLHLTTDAQTRAGKGKEDGVDTRNHQVHGRDSWS